MARKPEERIDKETRRQGEEEKRRDRVSLSPCLPCSLSACLLVLWLATAAFAAPLDEMSLDRWKLLRETETYQLQIAEKYYREQNWKVALPEYEKFLTLHEKSAGAPYAQLKWSLCQVHLRKGNTAIKDGFQSVIDYWPESPEAIAAAYYIGRTYKDIGQIPNAKKAYKGVVAKHADHVAAAYAMTDLGEIAELERDKAAQIELWKKLTFDLKRNKDNAGVCVRASQQLANHYFLAAAFDEAEKAVATSYKNEQLVPHLVSFLKAPLSQLAGAAESKAKADSLATRAVAYLREKTPTDVADPEKKKLARQQWLFIAEVYAAARILDKVPETYEQIQKQFGAEDDTLARLAAWYKSQGKYEEARATYRRYANALEGLGQVAYSHREQNGAQPDPAVLVYRELLGRNPEGQVRWKSEIGATYRAARKFKEAIDQYSELLSLDSAHAESWRWQIATAHQEAGQYKEAIGHFRQCVNFPENVKQMAWCHRQLKEYNEALLLYGQVVGGHAPSAPWAMLQLAYTREEAGQKEQAIKAFQQVCAKFPEDGHASAAHAHLQTKYKISVTLGGSTKE